MASDNPTLLRCSRCGQEKPTSDFYKDSHTKCGFRAACRVCTKAAVQRLATKKPKTIPRLADIDPARILSVVRYDDAAGVLLRRNGLPLSAKLTTKGYRMVTVLGRLMMEHRVVWLCAHGVWPDGQIDHVNHDRADNRLENLRVVTNAENHRNRKKQTDRGRLGVNRAGDRWRATITVNYKKIDLGRFVDRDDAIAARQRAEVRYGFTTT